MKVFGPEELSKLNKRSDNPENGEITIIGGSDLFHGAPILSLKTASQIVDMVYFSSPEPSIGEVASQIKSQLSEFIWVPWDEIDAYIKKSDSVLIGPGMKRWHKEEENGKYSGRIDEYDEAGVQTKYLTEKLIRAHPDKLWVIDGGSLQVINPLLIPKGAIITPNQKEFEILFNIKDTGQSLNMAEIIEEKARELDITIVYKSPVSIVCSPSECVEVTGGNAGLTKGGTGDVLAGLTVALLAKNEPLLAACAASWVVKQAADKLLDKLEMAIQALEYEKEGYLPDWFDEFWDNAEKYLKGTKLEKYLNYLREARSSEKS